jgi:hypothetical protein
LEEVDRYIQAGIRQFYYPPAVQGVDPGYEWSFVKPAATLSVTAADATVDLPDDLGRIVGDLHYAAGVYSVPVVLVSDSRMQALMQKSIDQGRPAYAAVSHKVSDGSNGQRQEITLWPIPDATYTLTYRYEAYSGKISESRPFPLGGMKHSELIVESCLAIAEQRANDEKGLHYERFVSMLVSAMAQDKKNGARFFGHMGGSGEEVVSRQRQSSGDITYKGETW